jgi:LysR family transcriptional activator of nhaA
MDWLNYHHLLYFWTVAKEGSISKASQELRLAQPTISGQIRALEESLGEKLFRRQGRGLVLTDVGRVVYRYAEEIFSLGREMQDALKDRPTGRPLRLQVGIADAVPKLIAYRLIQPALRTGEKVQLVCIEGKPERLLPMLAVHGLDLVISDAPVGPVKVRAFSHLLGESETCIFAAPKLAKSLKGKFPESLNGAPFLMPAEGSATRRALEQWLNSREIRPVVLGEFDDSALLNVFGQSGHGVFAAPSAIEDEITRQYSVIRIGRIESLRESFYAISVERKLKHPAVLAISQAARDILVS